MADSTGGTLEPFTCSCRDLKLIKQRPSLYPHSQCQSIIEASYVSAKQIADDVDFYGCLFHEFGKGLIKKCRTSPDAFIQMALQLAQFRVRVWASHHPLGVMLVKLLFFFYFIIFNSIAGPRTVLFDLRVIDDPYVQRRADRDGTILHVRGRGVRQSHGERWCNSKLDITIHMLHQMKVKLRSGSRSSARSSAWMAVVPVGWQNGWYTGLVD